MAVTVCRRPPEEGRVKLYLEYFPPVLSSRDGKPVYEEDIPAFIYEPAADVRQMRFNASSIERAQKLGVAREKAIRRGEIRSMPGPTDFLTFYEAVMSSKCSTCQSGLVMLRRFAGGSLPFRDVNLEFAGRYREWLSARPEGTKGRLIAQVTASTYFSQFRYVLGRAHQSGHIAENLATKLERISDGQTKGRMIDDEELKVLLACSYPDAEIRRMACLILLTGLRLKDVMNMKWEDIVDEGGIAHVKLASGRKAFMSMEAIERLGPSGRGYVFIRRGRAQWSFHMKEWTRAAGISRCIGLDGLRRRLPTLEGHLSP